MASRVDYYETLGVSRNASEAEIKKAYKKQAMRFHPDRNPEDETAEAKFKDVNEAYQILSNQNQRAAYDQFGHAGVEGAAGMGGAGAGGFSDVFEDIFGDIFGGAARAGAGGAYAQRGADLRYNLELRLEEAVHGSEVKIKVPTFVSCKTCDGTGAKKGTKPSTCGTCSGAGQVRMQQGFFAIQQTCPECKGVGQTISDPCSDCRGQGRKQEQKTLSVKIPAGVDTGDRIRLSGEGEAGTHGAPSGDLYVQVSVKRHTIFQREAANLHCEVPISFTTAVLGGELSVPTLDGHVKLKIPPETQSGKIFRLRGKGVKSVRGSTQGDLMCHVIVETPVKLSKDQKELLRQFEQSIEVESTPKSKTWFDSVKQFFETR